MAQTLRLAWVWLSFRRLIAELCYFSENLKIFEQHCLLTIDDSGHPPETQQDEETKAIKGVLVEDEYNVQHKGNHHYQTIKHLKFVLEKLPAIGVKFTEELHHEKGQKSQAEVVKNLQKGKQCTSLSENERRRTA